MNKYQYLHELNLLLAEMPAAERQEILEDFEEHFAFAKRAQKSDEEVIAQLGTPAEVAKELLQDEPTQEQADESDTVDKKDPLKETIKTLQSQAATWEEKFEEQAKKFEKHAKKFEEKVKDKDFGHKEVIDQVGSLVGDIFKQTASLVGNITETVKEATKEATFENAQESESLIVEQLDVPSIKNLTIDAKNMKVLFGHSEADKAVVRLTKGILSTKFEDDTLIIEARDVKKPIRRLLNFEPVLLEVLIPAVAYEGVVAKTTNGKIQLKEVVATGIALQTTNAKIEVADIKGNVAAATTNGKISFDSIDGNVEASTLNGKLEFDGISGNIKGETTNGKIELSNKTIAQNVALKTTNGKIEVETSDIPENVAIIGETTNGKVEIYGHEGAQFLLGEENYRVNLVTTNGKIEVKN